jgi:hypothetical protein
MGERYSSRINNTLSLCKSAASEHDASFFGNAATRHARRDNQTALG